MDGLKPYEIADQPVPLLSGGWSDGTGATTGGGAGVQVPDTIKDQPIPTAVIASDTISETLDTKTASIKGAYTFEQMGSLAIMSTTNPLAGVLISPSGILGTDVAGNTTFAIDSEDGSATFSGALVAATGTFAGTLSGASIIGGSIDIGGSDTSSFHVDTGGNLWLGGATFSSAAWRVSSTGSMDAGTSSFMSGRLIIDTGHTIAKTDGNLNITSANGDIVLSAFGNNISIQSANSLDVGGASIDDIDYLQFNTASNQGGDGTLWLFNAGGSTRYWRSRAGGFNGQFEQVGF